MPMMNCTACGRQISTAASSCPGCGHPVRSPDAPAGLIGKVTTVLGAWLVAPWVARLLAFVAACVVAIVMFRSGR
jgi:predicted amidophosphoribosyltransferase